MSSEASTDPSTGLRASQPELKVDPGLRPWQFFLLAGMLGATAAVIVATGQSPASIIFISVTILAASSVGLAVYRTLAPLVSAEQTETPPMVAGRTRVGLEREKTLVLRSIKELEFDYAMKKVAQADYDEMSGRLRSRAMRLMQQLEAGSGYRDLIEKELQTRLAGMTHASGAASAAPTETGSGAALAAPSGDDTSSGAALAAPSVGGAEAPPLLKTCACGTINDTDARFCKNCGGKLS